MRSKLAIAWLISVIVTCSPLLPKTALNDSTYSGSVRTISRIGEWLVRPPSTGLMKGCCDWDSSVIVE